MPNVVTRKSASKAVPTKPVWEGILGRALATAWLAALCIALAAVTARTAPLAAQRRRLVEIPPLAELDTRLLDILTLGYRSLYDDVATIFSIQMLVDEQLKTQASAAEVHAALRALTRHAPRLESLYMLGCFVMMLDFKAEQLCEPLTLDGMRALPESWRIPVTQGFMFANRLHDPAKAAIYYGLAASRPDAPAFLGKLTRNLIEKSQLDPAELQETLTQTLGARERSRFAKVLEQRSTAP